MEDGASKLDSRRHHVDDFEAAIDLFHERGWTDGLPVIPPTADKVAAFVAASGRAPDEVIAHYPSRNRIVTVEKVTINAVMAGCRPEYLPVVLAILEGMADDAFGIHAANATTGGSAIGFIVNGPIRTKLGMNYRGNVMGPGNRANSTIGRAVRLAQINVLGSVPGAGNEGSQDCDAGRPILDRATIGQPGKYAGYHIVENEEDYPSLRPLHVERGYLAEQSVVTVFAAAGHTQISVHAEQTAEEMVATLCHYLVNTGHLKLWGWLVLVIPPECADLLARDGWSKADVRRAIYEGTTRSVAWAKRNGWSRTGGLMDRRGGEIDPEDEERTLAIAKSADDVLIAVAGGPAGAFVHALLPYGGLASRVIREP